MEPQKGKPVTDEDEFYVNWGKETLKNNITLANDILKQLITLSSALLGVSIIYEHIVKGEFFKISVLLSFFISLIIALLGLLPYEKKVSLNSPSEIKNFKKKALKHKRLHLWISSIAIVVGFGLIIGELIVNMIIK